MRPKNNDVENDYSEDGDDTEDSDSEKLWAVKAILKENKRSYLVDWAGCDENGQPYTPTWVPKEDATPDLVQEWEATKTGQNTKPKQGSAAERAGGAASGSRGTKSTSNRLDKGRSAAAKRKGDSSDEAGGSKTKTPKAQAGRSRTTTSTANARQQAMKVKSSTPRRPTPGRAVVVELERRPSVASTRSNSVATASKTNAKRRLPERTPDRSSDSEADTDLESPKKRRKITYTSGGRSGRPSVVAVAPEKAPSVKAKAKANPLTRTSGGASALLNTKGKGSTRDDPPRKTKSMPVVTAAPAHLPEVGSDTEEEDSPMLPPRKAPLPAAKPARKVERVGASFGPKSVQLARKKTAEVPILSKTVLNVPHSKVARKIVGVPTSSSSIVKPARKSGFVPPKALSSPEIKQSSSASPDPANLPNTYDFLMENLAADNPESYEEPSQVPPLPVPPPTRQTLEPISQEDISADIDPVQRTNPQTSDVTTVDVISAKSSPSRERTPSQAELEALFDEPPLDVAPSPVPQKSQSPEPSLAGSQALADGPQNTVFNQTVISDSQPSHYPTSQSQSFDRTLSLPPVFHDRDIGTISPSRSTRAASHVPLLPSSIEKSAPSIFPRSKDGKPARLGGSSPADRASKTKKLFPVPNISPSKFHDIFKAKRAKDVAEEIEDYEEPISSIEQFTQQSHLDVRPSNSTNSDKPKGVSQDDSIQSFLEEKSDRSGNMIRERDWAKAGFKNKALDEPKKRIPMSEILTAGRTATAAADNVSSSCVPASEPVTLVKPAPVNIPTTIESRDQQAEHIDDELIPPTSSIAIPTSPPDIPTQDQDQEYVRHLDTVMETLNQREREIESRDEEIKQLRSQLANFEQYRASIEEQQKVSREELGALRKQVEEQQIASAEQMIEGINPFTQPAGPSGTSTLISTETQTDGPDTEAELDRAKQLIQYLESSKASLSSDLDLFRETYFQASEHAATLGRENGDLKQQVHILTGQLQHGLKQARLVGESQVASLKKQVQAHEGTIALLMERIRRTAVLPPLPGEPQPENAEALRADEIRRRAADWRNLTRENEELLAQIDLWRTEEERWDDEMEAYQDEIPAPLGDPHVAAVPTVEKPNLGDRIAELEEEYERLKEEKLMNEEVFPCEWVVGGAKCGDTFATSSLVLKHIEDAHVIQEEYPSLSLSSI